MNEHADPAVPSIRLEDLPIGIRQFLQGTVPPHEGDIYPSPVPAWLQSAILQRVSALAEHQRWALTIDYIKAFDHYIRIHLSIPGDRAIGGCDVDLWQRQHAETQETAMSHARGIALLNAIEQLLRL